MNIRVTGGDIEALPFFLESSSQGISFFLEWENAKHLHGMMHGRYVFLIILSR